MARCEFFFSATNNTSPDYFSLGQNKTALTIIPYSYRRFPGWVGLIFIRKVTAIAAVGTEAKNAPERFEKAFQKVPTSVWHIFTEPAECAPIIRAAVAKK